MGWLALCIVRERGLHPSKLPGAPTYVQYIHARSCRSNIFHTHNYRDRVSSSDGTVYTISVTGWQTGHTGVLAPCSTPHTWPLLCRFGHSLAAGVVQCARARARVCVCVRVCACVCWEEANDIVSSL